MGYRSFTASALASATIGGLTDSNVPAGGAPAFPDAFNAKPGPYGVSFTGMACSEPKLIELAYAFEQATKRRVPPDSAP